MSVKMELEVELNHHDPELIYDFMAKNVGPLSIHVLSSHAQIRFHDPLHDQIAYQTYNGTRLQSHPLRLTYAPVASTQPIHNHTHDDANNSASSGWLHKQLHLIKEGLGVGRSLKGIGKLLASHRKNMTEYICSYDLFLTSIADRLKKVSAQDKQKSEDELGRFLNEKLKDMTQQLKKSMRTANMQLKEHGIGVEPIQLDRQIEVEQRKDRKKVNSIEVGSFGVNLEHCNSWSMPEVKRLTALSDSTFVASVSANAAKQKQALIGKLCLYSTKEQYPFQAIDTHEVLYGVSVFDDYILAGTMDGKISYFPLTNYNQQYITPQMHQSYVTCILKITHNRIATLGSSQEGKPPVKFWKTQNQQIATGMTTLLFEGRGQFGCRGQNVSDIQLWEQDKSVLASTAQNIFIYNTEKQVSISAVEPRKSIKRMKQVGRCLGLANSRFVSLCDMRSRSVVSEWGTKEEVWSLETLGQRGLFWGGERGRLGVVDIRKGIIWQDSRHHKKRVTDLCAVGGLIISADKEGQVISWSPNQLPNTH